MVTESGLARPKDGILLRPTGGRLNCPETINLVSGHAATTMTTTQNKENNPILLKRGIIYLILWLIFLWQMWPKFTSFLDAGVINVFNQQLQGNYAIIALIVLVLICVALCAIGLKDIFIYVKGRPEDNGDDN